MMKRRSTVAKLAVLAMLAVSASAPAKDKKKTLLPADILHAGTVLVIVDPAAGVDLEDPNANRLARANVEQALEKWGRFRLVHQGYTADLIIVVRKGNGKFVQPTIAGTPVNGTPPGSINSTTGPNGSTTRAGGRWGSSGISNDPANAGNQTASPQPQIEAGSTQDSFTVYRGNTNDPKWSPLDAPALWRYIAKNALESPSVPAVDEFRKAIAQSEKQLASTP